MYTDYTLGMFSLPVFIRKLWFGERHSLETTAAVVFGGNLDDVANIYAGSIGYRFTGNKITFRAVFSPMLFSHKEVIPMVGFSIGHNF